MLSLSTGSQRHVRFIVENEGECLVELIANELQYAEDRIEEGVFSDIYKAVLGRELMKGVFALDCFFDEF